MPRSRPVRLIAAVAAALLLLAAFQPAAGAVTSRTLSLSVSPTSALTKAPVRFSGKLSSSPKGTSVKVQRKVGTSWVLVKTTRTTTSAGAYATSVALPTVAGTYSYRTVAAKSGNLAAATSRVVKVTALTKVFVSLTASPTTVTAGSTTTLSGIVRPFVAGSTVALKRLVGSSWVSVTTTKLNSNGQFSKAVTVNTTGAYRAAIARIGLKAAGISAPRTVTATPANPVISTSSLPNATQNAAYETTLTAAGGPAGTWTAAPLPTGLTVDPGTGIISGTPTTTGTVAVAVNFTQTSTGLAATPKNLNLTVDPPAPPVISTTALPNATQGTPYQTTLTVAGGPAGTWTAAPLPTGLTVDPGTGIISGTPTTTGTVAVAVNFTQTSTGLAATQKNLDLTVDAPPAPVISTSFLPNGTQLSAYSTQLAAVGNPTGTWSATGLPPGLSLTPSTGVISGVPTFAGDSTVTVGFTQTGNPSAATPIQLSLHIGGVGSPINTVKVDTGGLTGCRIKLDQTLWCWGAKEIGQLGLGGALEVDPDPEIQPQQVGSATDWVDVSQGGSSLPNNAHACGIRTTSVAYCWGADAQGELGNGVTPGAQTSPSLVSGGLAWQSISAGFDHTCGITTSGTLYCWGDDSFGQLGSGGTGDKDVPTQVGTDGNWKSVSAGYTATCAVKNVGTLYCWGFNPRGQLGTGDRTDHATPIQVGADTNWATVSNGEGFTCATKTTGTAWCWGPSSNGELGNSVTLNDSTTDELSPHQVGVATTWKSVSAGSGHACATNTAGEVWCWGYNFEGQVGDASQTNRSAPVKVGTATDWATVSTGGVHTCAVKDSGAVWCWGANNKGQLGINATAAATPRSTTPVGAIP